MPDPENISDAIGTYSVGTVRTNPISRNAPLPFAVSKGVISAVMLLVNTGREGL
jgi:hypothetical protein